MKKEEVLRQEWKKAGFEMDENNEAWRVTLQAMQVYSDKQLLIHSVSQQRELLEWLSNEDYFNIPKDEISEILEDWQTYNSNCG